MRFIITMLLLLQFSISNNIDKFIKDKFELANNLEQRVINE